MPCRDLKDPGKGCGDLVNAEGLGGCFLRWFCQDNGTLYKLLRVKAVGRIGELQFIAPVPFFHHPGGHGIAELSDPVGRKSRLRILIQTWDHPGSPPSHRFPPVPESQRPPSGGNLHVADTAGPGDAVPSRKELREVLTLNRVIAKAAGVIGIMGLTV